MTLMLKVLLYIFVVAVAIVALICLIYVICDIASDKKEKANEEPLAVTAAPIPASPRPAETSVKAVEKEEPAASSQVMETAEDTAEDTTEDEAGSRFLLVKRHGKRG